MDGGAAMISSNLAQVIHVQISKLENIEADEVARKMALGILPELKKRVHVDGKDSSGQQIGTYSNAYLNLRSGDYGNSSRVSRGNNKGKLKDAGSHIKGNAKGASRPKYNRGSDPKVILSLTRQMENDMTVIADGKGYAIGFNNPLNFKKSQWNEATYKKPIWNLTEGEISLSRQIAIDEVANQTS
jgi:hypothetical protein